MTDKEFEKLASQLRPRLLLLVRSYARASGEDAEDIVQEAVLTLWKLYQEEYPVRDPHALSVRIAKRICVSHYRKKHLFGEYSGKCDCAGGYDASSITDAGDCRIIMETVMDSLSETQKEYLYLRNEENMSLDEISNLTGRPKTSIKSTISAARRLILDIVRKEL